MESVTPVNCSRIPRVNFSAPRLGRSASNANASIFGGAMSGKEKPKPRTQPPGEAKSGRNVLHPRTGTLKRPSTAAQENFPEAKRQAMAPPPNQKGKLPPWDLKGKLKLADGRNLQMKATLDSHKFENEELKSKNKILVQQVKCLEAELKEKKENLEFECRLLQDCKERADKLQMKCDEIERVQRDTSFSLESANHNLAMKEERLKLLTSELEELKSSSYRKEAAFSAQAERLMETEKKLTHFQEECWVLKENIKEYEVQRKALHNKVMELKGNIRVFCRVRPLLPAESKKNSSIEHINFTGENALEVFKGPQKSKNSFSFDRVFPTSAVQAEIFEELSELVQSVIDGYNVCVFAYGQTGSGKTYTMEGGLGDEARGMIPRSVDMIFEKLEGLGKVGWTYNVEASFLEIYNEQVRDLLQAGQTDKPCEIRNPISPGGDMLVTNLKVETVKSAVQVNELLNTARTNRAVAATVHNDHSSRSHFVFKLRLKLSNGGTKKDTDSILSLVDLAGSERLVDITENARVAETKNINKSLSNLGNVILALSQKNEHVPYRNSKLTHLLQPSLGGNSKTLMLINVSPREECVEETLNSLRFAMRVNECHIGQARRKLK